MSIPDGRELKPSTIMRNAYAVYPSLAMLAGMQLDVFTPLQDGPMKAEEIAERLSVNANRLSPLLYALVSAGLLTVEGGVFANTEEADHFLVRGRLDYMGGLHRFYNSLWQAVLKTADSIRTGEPQAEFDWISLPQDRLLDYFRGQFPNSLYAGRQLGLKIDFSRFDRLLDAGGGTAGVSIGICEAHQNLKATVVDLPEVVPITKQFVSEAGMDDIVSVAAGDIVKHPPEGSYDVAVLRGVIQVLSPHNAKSALKNIYKSMRPGGCIYIVGTVLDDTRLHPPASIAFSLVFINTYQDGQAYTENEHQVWLEEAGFTDVSVEHDATSDGLGIVSAIKK